MSDRLDYYRGGERTHERVVTSCSDCDFRDRRDFYTTFNKQCYAGALERTFGEPPPDDCPLRDGPVVVRLDV